MLRNLNILWCLCLIAVKLSTANIVTKCGIPKCLYRQVKSTSSSVMEVNNQPLKTNIIGISLMPPSSDECYLNAADVLDSYQFDGDKAVAVLIMRCAENYTIHFLPDARPTIPNAVFHVQVENCLLTTDGLNTLSNRASFNYVSFINSHPLQKYSYCDGSKLLNSNCGYLKSANAIGIILPEKHNSITFSEMFECNETFPSVKELLFRRFDLNQHLSHLKYKFPNVQDLQISDSFLKTSPNFPWNNKRMYFENNKSLSETGLYDSASRYNVIIEPNMQKRVLNLNSNDIETLVGFRFDGYLDMLKLSGNGLSSFSSFTFSGLQGLQHLDLSVNYLSNIPIDAFRGLTSLRHMNLHANLLSVVSDDMFYYNTELVYLDLSNNSISMIGPHAFSRLNHLQELRLEYNSIVTVSYSMFPAFSVSFKSLILDGNPLSAFPEAVLYFKTLQEVSLRYTSISFQNFTQMLLDLNFSLLAEGNAQSTTTTETDLLKVSPRRLKRIDLTGSKINNLHLKYFGTSLSARLNARMKKLKLLILLKYFQFILTDNPIHCDCRINHLTRFVKRMLADALLRGNEYFFNDWKCASPAEFRYKPIFQVPESETYCEIDIPKCPATCSCYERSVSGITIVDCRNRGLTDFPEQLPDGILDLWFQNNNITNVTRASYLSRTRQLLLSGNKYLKVSPEVIRGLDILKLAT